jgi:autotransporter-associated beta strand protein
VSPITGTSALSFSGPGTLDLLDYNNFTGGTTIAGGELKIVDDSSLGAVPSSGTTSANVSINGGTLGILTSLTTSAARIFSLGAAGGSLDVPSGQTWNCASNITGPGALTETGGGVLELNTNNTYSGGTVVTAGVLLPSGATSIGSGGVTLNGGTLQFAAGAAFDASAQGLSIGPSGGTIDTNGNSISFADQINNAGTGGGTLIKTGAGTLTLNAQALMPVLVTGGTLAVAGPLSGRAGVVPYGVTVTNNANLVLAGSNQSLGILNHIAPVTLNGGTLTTDGTATVNQLGAITLNGGTVTAVGSGSASTGNVNFILYNTVNVQANSNPSTISAPSITFANSPIYGIGGTFNVARGTAGVDLNISSNIVDYPGVGAVALTKTGNGILQLSGNNTYSGGTNFNGGTITISGPGSLGSGPLTFNGGTLQMEPLADVFDASTLGINIQAGGATIDTNGFNKVFFQPFGGGGSGGLTKTGGGGLEFLRAANYTGPTSVNQGELWLGPIASLASNSISVSSGALMKIFVGGSIPTSAALTVNGTFIDAALADNSTTRTIQSLSGGPSGSVILNGSQLKITGGGNFAGAINDGTLPGSLWVDNGTLTLGGANTFTGGTTVNSGATLNVNGSLPATGSLNLFTQATVTLPGATGTSGLTQQLGAMTIGSLASVTVEPSTSAAQPAVLEPASLNLVSQSSRLNLTNNELIVGNSSLSAVRTALANGQIFSSSSGGVLGYADLGNENIEVRFTLLGDTNLDGSVNVADLANLAGNFGKTGGATWIQGDFDNDGNVNVADLADLAGNFGQTLVTGSAATDAVATSQAAAVTGTATAVPEPGRGFTITGAAAILLLTRRQRRWPVRQPKTVGSNTW